VQIYGNCSIINSNRELTEFCIQHQQTVPDLSSVALSSVCRHARVMHGGRGRFSSSRHLVISMRRI